MRYLPLLVLLVFTACRDKSRTVLVNVKQNTNLYSSFEINYTIDAAGNEYYVNTAARNWSSPGRIVEAGEFMRVRVRSLSAQSIYTITIYVDGVMWKQAVLMNGAGPVEVSGTIPHN